MRARHWIVGGFAVLALVGAYVLGDHSRAPSAPGSSKRPREGLSGMLDRTLAAAGGSSASGVVTAPAQVQAPSPTQAGPDSGFGFADVEAMARARSQKPYEPGSAKLPNSIAHLTYDQYQSIHFRRADALWRNQSLYEVQFFHRGFNFDRRVGISEVVDGVAHPVPYNPTWFDFGKVVRQPGKLPRDLGYAGFRIHYPLHSPGYKDELIVFLGASFFRVLGRNQDYGLTARGLAINTASKAGEEFPWFTDFWLVRPTDPEQRTLTLYALLDSESISGAYQFKVRPGSITQVEVASTLYPRRSIQKLGIAPLTSMFLFGADPAGHRFDDYRPQVHDSDGFMAQTGSGEWLWRPLNNPRELRINRFMDQQPRGFGLIQRDRDFTHYQDPVARFQRRPSYWIQPLGDWGKGGAELVEIPTDEAIHDNIALYWVPEQAVTAGKELKFSYLLSAHLDSPMWPPGAKAIATRITAATPDEQRDLAHSDARRVIIDFAGGDLDDLDASQPLKALLTVNGGTTENVTVQRVMENGVWRVTFLVVPAHLHDTVDMHCFLQLYGESLSETWTYQLTT
ncbi:MAG TPA: glucan biosynthesis protein G [Steroidobacteraceae bacterium]|nr:glucan biosynthesis protein G [Steroidobacteraceae bacterium]